jgi:hypothetical protein
MLIALAAACEHHTTESPAAKVAPAVAPAVPPAPVPGDAMSAPVAVELQLPATIATAKLGELMIAFTVKNLGTQTIDPQLNASELRVNGVVSQDWNMALGNSGHEKRWRALPPGETVSGRWPLGNELFPKPGDYTVTLTVMGVTSAQMTVHVTK